MVADRAMLLEALEDHYGSQGWRVESADDGTLRAAGPGGVTWIGAAVGSEEVASDEFEQRLAALASRRMPGSGELCPLDLLIFSEWEPRLRAVLDRLGLTARPHVSVYSLPAA